MDNIMDPELASEMVKLLAQELKVVRAQLREAETRTSTPYISGHSNELTHERAQALNAENEFLKEDNTTLQGKLAKLQDELARVSSIKSEEEIPSPSHYAVVPPQVNEDVARLLAEHEDLIREKVAEEASRNEEKLTILQEKYKRSKAKVHEYNEILNELRASLKRCTEELEQSRKAVSVEIDFRSFLRAQSYKPVKGQPEFSSIQPCHRHIHAELHKEATNVCKCIYFINCSEVIWSPSGIALGLVIKPIFQYNPRTPGGAWTKLEDSFDVGKQMDVCCLSDKSGKICRYLGTYERVADQDTMVIAPEALKQLSHEKLNHASKRTILFPDFVPPSQVQMIDNMYKQGVIKLQCFVIRCVGINQTFVEKLRETRASSAQGNPSDDSTILTSGGGVRKRNRDPKWVGCSNRSKKRKY